ncbi:hypothetical protein C1I98_03550 [Spongiactinospora gelatinilytica]|uniref:Nucleotidyltransferase AbiEii toxin of type IV toxin-antitoxin system n=1 Tax=Spongiactinospora gelatinilytica TaxID=2666298 RepID=A0A2W2J1N6_9ACTN|nr:hypothetical protein [Spongiactinospora gelatinilytica]PZG55504.1 hypothetical protein C1I98_03550 [Spongiactinospora gelatinilytica]
MDELRLPEFHERLVSVLSPIAERHGLALAGGHAMMAHGLAERPGESLRFAVTGEEQPAGVAWAVAEACRAAGFEVGDLESGPRASLLLVTEPVTGQTCRLALLREALQAAPVRCGDVAVVALPDAIGLRLRDLHGRGLARDFRDAAEAGRLYPFRELEHLARLHDEDFSLEDLVMRLEGVDLVADTGFMALGVPEERVDEIRRFAYAWADDIKLRRAEDGDLDPATDFDLPAVDD